jgi:hypothetical protein
LMAHSVIKKIVTLEVRKTWFATTFHFLYFFRILSNNIVLAWHRTYDTHCTFMKNNTERKSFLWIKIPTLQKTVLTKVNCKRECSRRFFVLPHSALLVSLRTVARARKFRACHELTRIRLYPLL